MDPSHIGGHEHLHYAPSETLREEHAVDYSRRPRGRRPTKIQEEERFGFVHRCEGPARKSVPGGALSPALLESVSVRRRDSPRERPLRSGPAGPGPAARNKNGLVWGLGPGRPAGGTGARGRSRAQAAFESGLRPRRCYPARAAHSAGGPLEASRRAMAALRDLDVDLEENKDFSGPGTRIRAAVAA